MKPESAKIADLIRNRFRERYLEPALDNPKRHGFAMLAIGCLMVETLESFRNGWKSTSGKSEAAFCSFFQVHDEFKDLRPVAHDFDRAIRCGITSSGRIHGWLARAPGVGAIRSERRRALGKRLRILQAAEGCLGSLPR